MTTNERIKYLRVDLLDMSQRAFAIDLNIRDTTICAIERGRKQVNNRVISDICRAYFVNESWLKTGEGEIFKKELSLDDLAKKQGLTEVHINLVKDIIKLDHKLLDAFIDMFSK